MLAFMAYPAPRDRGTSTTAVYSTGNDSVTTASMDERPPHSFLSLSTEASSAMWEDDNDPSVRRRHRLQEESYDSDQDLHRKAKSNCCADQDTGKKPTNTTAMYIEQIYEHTVHGPCQTVTMCEVEHLDLFMNCQQPLSFLGFGHHPSSMDPSFHGGSHADSNYHEDDMPLPGAYDVPKGCEYCGAAHTRDCVSGKCRRPKLFFQKKRPPFAPPDDTTWDPTTDLAIDSGTSPRKQPTPHTHRH